MPVRTRRGDTGPRRRTFKVSGPAPGILREAQEIQARKNDILENTPDEVTVWLRTPDFRSDREADRWFRKNYGLYYNGEDDENLPETLMYGSDYRSYMADLPNGLYGGDGVKVVLHLRYWLDWKSHYESGAEGGYGGDVRDVPHRLGESYGYNQAFKRMIQDAVDVQRGADY